MADPKCHDKSNNTAGSECNTGINAIVRGGLNIPTTWTVFEFVCFAIASLFLMWQCVHGLTNPRYRRLGSSLQGISEDTVFARLPGPIDLERTSVYIGVNAGERIVLHR
jgi:hypothetical protein